MENDLGNVNKAEVQGLGIGGTPKFRGLVDTEEATKQPGKEHPERWKKRDGSRVKNVFQRGKK